MSRRSGQTAGVNRTVESDRNSIEPSNEGVKSMGNQVAADAKSSFWKKLRSKNPLLFSILLVVIAGSCN